MDSFIRNSQIHTFPYNFGAIPPSNSGPDGTVYLVPHPYDTSISPTANSKAGPGAILTASRNLELFDSEINFDTYKIGLFTMDELLPNTNSPFDNSQLLKSVSSKIHNLGKFPVILGGDHSITFGAVCAAFEKYSDVGVLIFDAHPDLFDRHSGTKYSHASIARRVYELGIPVSFVGLRSTAREELEFIDQNEIVVVNAKNIIKSPEAIDNITNYLSANVYISIDLDVLDPSEMPSVGYPEPGGLRWYDVVGALENVIRKKNIVGFDVVELCPIPGNSAPDFLAAKLIYRMIGLIFKDKLLNGKY